ncbi:MAG: autotransporter domain-containing protein, partial [Actinobacillus porcinus]|uniref:autotransporter outer membrane beta-barrel domain-containing protein n=1 Tax=Actinobacillus porcinus TaxID=51048 RepID=UPI00235748D6
APVVSAAVARVWEKFPWMSNHLVTQTILSTANQLGTNSVTSGPNGDIGWGVLNVERALKGPARFDKRLLISSDNGFVTANFGYRHYTDKDRLTWSNDISGDAGFKKQGTGTLYFSGKNTYTGDTHIEGGVLGISNALTASNVTVFEQGTLLAENPDKKVDIQQNLTNNGSVEIYGQGLTVGNYTASANARTIIDIHTAALDVKGTANFNGSRIVADVAKVNEVPKQQEQTRTILTAQTLTGFNGDYRVSDHIYPYIDVTSIAQKGNNIEATYKRNSTEYVLKKANALTRSAVNTGRNLDRVLDEVATTPNSALKAQALAVLHAQPLAVSRTVESLSAEIYASTPNILLNAHRTFSRQIADQAMEKWDTQDSHLYAATAYRRYHLAQTGYRKGEVKSAQTYVGADKKWANFVLGAAVYVDRSNADFSGSIGTAKITQTGAALYGAYKGEHIYALTEFSTAHSKNQIKRSLQFPDKQQLLRNDVKSRLYGIYTELGYRFKGLLAQGQHWEVAPYLAYRTDWLHQSAFDEKSLFALRADAVHHRLPSYGMGLRSAWHWDKWRLKGSIAHRYQHRSHRSFDFEGNYIGAQSAVKIEGISAPTSLTTANLNLSYAATHALDLFAGYELSHQAGGETGNEISLGLRFRF